jgi:aspartyl-tRNA(Asn)/glutamyl-tRNA(Gln) amidotransferase subunit C
MPTLLKPQTLKKIANLARLYDNPELAFLEKSAAELEPILNYVEELKEVDVEGIDPLSGNRTISISQLREDNFIDSPEYQRIRLNIIKNFPSSQGDLLMVPAILNN